MSSGKVVFWKCPRFVYLCKSVFSPSATSCCSSHGRKGSSVDPNWRIYITFDLIFPHSHGRLKYPECDKWSVYQHTSQFQTGDTGKKNKIKSLTALALILISQIWCVRTYQNQAKHFVRFCIPKWNQQNNSLGLSAPYENTFKNRTPQLGKHSTIKPFHLNASAKSNVLIPHSCCSSWTVSDNNGVFTTFQIFLHERKPDAFSSSHCQKRSGNTHSVLHKYWC